MRFAATRERLQIHIKYPDPYLVSFVHFQIPFSAESGIEWTEGKTETGLETSQEFHPTTEGTKGLSEVRPCSLRDKGDELQAFSVSW